MPKIAIVSKLVLSFFLSFFLGKKKSIVLDA